MKHKISLARAVYSRAKTVLIDDIFHTLGKLSSTFIYENCIRGELMRDRTIIVAVAHPDMFWARDARLFINMASGTHEGFIDATESDPEKIVALIQSRRKSTKQPMKEEQHHVQNTDIIDALFDNPVNGSGQSTYNNTLFDEDFFDEASVIPDSIRHEEEEEEGLLYKSRDYAYATYYAACGGWKYWTSAILFTLFARLANISESYWLKEGKTPILLYKKEKEKSYLYILFLS
jgi:hypothetical protein